VKNARTERSAMAAVELRAAVSLAGIFALRMLGLFMILPVFALYAEKLEGATPALMGLALGAYGMTQALLQIPFGLLSDRFGRKPLILAGLFLFALGSVVAALSDGIYGIILGRALQGSGAIAAAVMALAADLTREEHRTKVMAIIGMSIGLSFSVSLVAGPILDHWIGIAGIFWLTAVLALLGIAVLVSVVPTPVSSHIHRDAEPVPAQFGQVLRDAQLLRLDFGILTLHMILTASFTALPLVLRDYAGLPASRHWWVYLPVLVLSVITMIPLIIYGERRRRVKTVFLGAIVAVVASMLGLAEGYRSLMGIVVSLFVFYVGFNVLESSLPSLISRMAPPASKGTAMGFYSSSQFLGAFLGGSIGGWLHGAAGFSGVFVFCAAGGAVWFAVAIAMADVQYLKTRLLRVGTIAADEATLLSKRLSGVAGVVDVVVIPEEGVAYLKVDEKLLDENAIEAALGSDARGAQLPSGV
jgi:MFS family permease